MQTIDPFKEAVSRFGATLKPKFAGIGASGSPEDQLRGPLDQLIQDIVGALGWAANVVLIGESSVQELKTRPDFAVTKQDLLVGFIEVKAPGKGADPRRFDNPHDREQWQKLKLLPNLVYTDGNSFSLWQDGELHGDIVRLEGSVESAGAALSAPAGLLRLFTDFLDWTPIPPRSAQQLANISARLCRLLRDEVIEQIGLGSAALTSLAADWRRTLFPEASNETFADGYAQAVTFGLLMARAQGVALPGGLDQISRALRQTNLLIGTALRVLTDDVDNQATLKTSLDTLTRVLDVVHWPTISRGSPEAWLYFYEGFLSVYDLGVLQRIAERTEEDQGQGAVPAVIRAALRRLIGFEMQFGPFAVAQLRLTAEVLDLLKASTAEPEHIDLRLFLTDTLGNPNEEHEYIPHMLSPLAASRRSANLIKRAEPITVVIGNPPYRERARGRGGWVESGTEIMAAPLRAWAPPVEWGVSAHVKHLRNLYVYFWRWATWKVFGGGIVTLDAPPATPQRGIVCFITVAGFLNGPGFQKMRADLRRDTDEIWVIDCSPEGHQPPVGSRVFQAVQQPVCIVLALRLAVCDPATPARVRFRSLPVGTRDDKFAAISKVTLDGGGWADCPSDWRAPFLPAATSEWGAFPKLGDFFVYNGSGVMPGRTWVIAPDADTLRRRWDLLIQENNPERKELLFHPHKPRGELGDRHAGKVPSESLHGHEPRMMSVASDKGPAVTPIRYGFRA